MVTGDFKLSGSIDFSTQAAEARLRSWDQALAQAATKADKALGNVEGAFKSLGPAADNASKGLSNVGSATQKTAGQIGQAGTAAQRTGGQFTQTTSASQNLSRSLDGIDNQAKSAASGLDASAKAAQSAESGFSGFAKTAAAFGVGMVGAGSALSIFQGAVQKSIGSALDLEKSVANISTIKPEIDTKAVTASILDMSTRVAQSSDQLADSLYNIFSSIEISQEGALQLTEKFARGAVAAQTDAETFGTAVLGVMNAYRIGVEGADHISDVFFNTIRDGVVTGQQLAASLGPVTQSAKAAGVDLESLGGLIAGVTKEGGEAAQNINNLNNLFQKITTKDAQAALKGLGVATQDAAGNFRPVQDILGDLRTQMGGFTEAAKLAAIQKIFPDAQARQGAQTIISQLDFVNKAIEDNKTQAGSAGKAYDTMAQTGAASTQIFLNNLSKIGTEAAQKVLPAVNDLTAGMTRFIQDSESAGKGAAGGGGIFGFLGESARGAFERTILPAKAAIAVIKESGEAGETAGKRIDTAKDRFFDFAEMAGYTEKKVYDLNVAQLESSNSQAGVAQVAMAQVSALQAQAQAAEASRASTVGLNVAMTGVSTTQGVALTPVQTLAQAFGIQAESSEELAKQVKALGDKYEAAAKQIKGFAETATPATDAASRQEAALKGIVSQATAMAAVPLSGQMQEWAARAHELADASGATGKPLADLHTTIGMIAQGGPGAAGAVESLKKQVEGISAPTQAAAQADRDYLAAQSEMQQSLLRTPQLVNDLVASMKNFVNEFLVAIGRVPAGARDAVKLTEDAVTIDLSKPGADLAISLANGFGRETIRITDAAGNVIREVKGTLSEADMSPEGVAFMQKVAAGVAEGGLTVQESARKVLTDAGIVMQTEAQTAVTNANTTLGLTAQGVDIKPNVDVMASVIDPSLRLAAGAGKDSANSLLGEVADAPTRTKVKQNADSAGSDFSKGWQDGINSIDIVATTRQIFSDAVGAVKGVLGIKSPSSVMHEAGVNFMQGFIDGTGSMAGALTSFMTELAQSAFDKFKSTLGGIGGALADVGRGALGAVGIGGGGGGDVDAWLKQAMQITGVDASWLEPLKWLVAHESGGNPNAVNPQAVIQGGVNYGHATGLLQTIPGTFAANNITGGSITDPVANAAAAIEYIKRTYGHPSVAVSRHAAQGGYAGGVRGLKSGQGWVGEEGPERFSLSPTNGLTIYPHDISMAMSGGRAPGYAGGTVGAGGSATIPPLISGGVLPSLDGLAAGADKVTDSFAPIPPLLSGGVLPVLKQTIAASGAAPTLHTAPLGGGLHQAGLQIGGGELGGVFDEDTLMKIARAVEQFNRALQAGAIDSENYDRLLSNLGATFAQLNSGVIGDIAGDFSLITVEVEKSRAALEGATAAWAKMQHDMGMTEQFGAGAGPINSLMEAISANTPEAGAVAVQSLQQFIASLPDTLGPQVQETGNYLRFLLFQALDPTNSGQREELLSRFSAVFADLQAQQEAAATLNAQTYAGAYATALSAAQLEEKVGPTFTRLFDLIAQQAKEGSEQTIGQIGEMSVGIEREIGRLPDALKGPILQEWRAAWGTFLETGDVGALEQAATRANRALTLIPDGFLEATPQLQQAILDIIASMDDLGLSSEEAAKRIEQATKGAAEGAAREAQRVKDVEANRVADLKASGQAIGTQEVARSITAQLGGGGGGSAGGSNAKAEMFAAAAASPGGWTPALAAAWHDGMNQIADAMNAEVAMWQEAIRVMEQSTLTAEMEQFAAWTKQFGEEWLKVILETKGVQAAFSAYHGRVSPSIAPMAVGGGGGGNDGPYVFNIYLDGRSMGQAIVPHISREMQANVMGMAGGSYS